MTAAVEAGMASVSGIGRQGIGEGQVSQKMTATRSSAAQSTAFAQASGSTAESFQARWQSMLALLGASAKDASAQGADGDRAETALTAPEGHSTGSQIAADSALPIRDSLFLSQTGQKAQAEESRNAGTPASDSADRMLESRLAGASRFAAQTQEAAPESASASAREIAKAGQGTGVSHSSPNKTAKQKEASNSGTGAQIAALAGNLPAATPAPVNIPAAQNSASSKSGSDPSTPHPFADPQTGSEAGNSRSQSLPFSARSGSSAATSQNPGSASPGVQDGLTLAGQGSVDADYESPATEPDGEDGRNLSLSGPSAAGSQQVSADHLPADSLTANAAVAQNAVSPAVPDPGQATSLTGTLAVSQGAAAGSAAGDAAMGASAKLSANSESRKFASSRGISSSAQSATHAVSAATAGSIPSAGASLAAAAQAHAMADGKGIASASSTGPTGRTDASISHDPFAALDAAPNAEGPSWIHAGTHQAEAGFQDPSLGWVGVRAQVSGDGIHASLLPGSADAAQALSGHLAGLNTYLAEQHTPVATLTMAANPDAQSGYSSGQSPQQQTGQNDGQSPQGPFTPNVTNSAPHASTADATEASKQAVSIEPNHSGSRYVSVMA